MAGRLGVAVTILVMLGPVGCATLADDGAPAAAVREAPAWLAGSWQGTIRETPAWFNQGQGSLRLTVASDGSWTGTMGASTARGTIRALPGRVVIDGGFDPGPDPGTIGDRVHFSLAARDGSRLYGPASVAFGDRTTSAMVELTKVP